MSFNSPYQSDPSLGENELSESTVALIHQWVSWQLNGECHRDRRPRLPTRGSLIVALGALRGRKRRKVEKWATL
jgi:hypothetical protein